MKDSSVVSNGSGNARRGLVALISAIVMSAAITITAAPALAVTAPTLATQPATNVDYTSADLHGTVDPEADGVEIVWNLQYTTEPGNPFAWQTAAIGSISSTEAEGSTPIPVSGTASGLRAGQEYAVRLFVYYENFNASASSPEPFETFTTKAVPLPSVEIDQPTSVTAHGAHFSGTINPEAPAGNPAASNVSWHFQCNPGCPGLSGTIAADSNDHVVEATATGLQSNTAYEVTLVAENAGGSASDGPDSFSTAVAPPAAVTIPAFALVGGTEALLAGTVTPENSPTTYWFQYGSDQNYGTSVPASEDGEAGSGEAPVFVTEKVSGLVPGTEYHYRLVTENVTERTYGRDMTFVTPTGTLGSSIGAVQLPENRHWEMVSPPNKNSADIWKVYVGASADGQAVSYKSQGSFAGLPTAKGGNLADYRATRSSSAWISEGLTPQGGVFTFTNGAFEMSDDKRFTRFNLRERGNESPDEEVELDPNDTAAFHQYLRNNETKKFKRIPYPVDPSQGMPYASSTDNSNFAVTTVEDVTHEAPCDAEAGPCVYESHDHGFTWKLASVLPDDSAAQGALVGMAQDGSRLYFRSGGNNYERIGGDATVQLPGGAGTTIVAIEGGSGTRVLLRSSEQLLGSDEDSAEDLYVWDGSKPEGAQLTLVSQGDQPGVEVQLNRVLGYQEDMLNTQRLDRGFFVAGNQVLAGEDSSPGQKIYAWDTTGGQPSLSYVATADPTDSRTSPNGRFLVFTSNNRLTAYDNAGQQEVYRYDQDTKRLVCVSCQPQGTAATAEGRLYYISPQESAFGIGHALRNVNDAGLVFFESLERLSNHDSNGEPDVYEYSEGLPHLLSKGTGPHQSRFADASVSGNDVFIITDDQLSGWDIDRSYDLYDVRVGGGLPEPPAEGIPCEGDSCQPVPNPPNDPTPASENFNGAGNVKPLTHKKKHHKKKHHKKHHKKKHHGKRKSTGKNG